MRKRVLRKKILAALAAGVVFCSGHAWAAEDTSQDTNFQFDKIIVTADRVSQTVGEAPANVTVITGAEIKQKGARTLAEVLTGVSGVSVKAYGDTGQAAYAYIFGTERVVVLVDGIRMNLPQGVSSGAGGIDVNTLLLGDNIDRIEIVRGGASTLYGADAVGGVINIITKKGSNSDKTTATVAGGNYGTRLYELSAGGTENKTHWHLTGTKDTTDGQRSNSAYEGKKAALRVDQDLSENEGLHFTYDYYGSHAGMPDGLSAASSAYSLTDFQNVLRHYWSLGYTKQHGAGSRTLRYYDNEQVYSGESYAEVFRHQSTVRALEYQDSAQWSVANLVAWGGEWRQEQVKSTGEQDAWRDRTTKAVYLQNHFQLNTASKLTLGVRRDENNVYGTHWLPQAAYMYQINSKTSYFANWAKTFKAPTFDDLYGYYYSGYMVGNVNLKPESGWTAETGIKSRLSAASELSVSVFKREISDAIEWAYNASSYTWKPENIEQYKATGVNTSIITKLSPQVTTDFGYTYLESCDQTGADVGDPRHSIHLGINVQHENWTQAVYGVYQDKTGTGTSRVGGHFIINANTNYSLKKGTILFLTIKNLLDKPYQEVYDYPASRRTVLFGIKESL